VLTYKDKKLLEGLAGLRTVWTNKAVWRAAALLLTPAERFQLNKMVILQNISNGEKVAIPPEPKVRPRPKRIPFTKSLLAKV
jgi:hypothetical protein